MPTPMRITVLLFLSGFCSLVYQVSWLRLLRLVFGSSTASTAVVLAIFMGGLGLGGALLGRRAERSSNPLLFYSWLEAGIALTAALSPLLIAGVRQLYLALGGVSTLGSTGATALRIALSVVVLAVPTTLMGGTLPAVARAFEKTADHGRRVVATFYGVNTLGAVAGAFLTTFVFLELFGVRQSLWLAALVNALLALVVRAMAKEADALEETPKPAGTGAAADGGGELDAARPVPAGQSRAVFVTAGLVGFLFFLMEIVWYRMLAPVLGGSSYTFGLILTLALLGIGAGGALYGMGAAKRRPTLAALAATCLLEALFMAWPYALGDDLALLAAVARPLGVLGFGGLVMGWTLVTAIVVLPAALVSGYQFPLMVALLGSGRERVATQVGWAYACNTWGAILGSMAGGFVLLPLLTAPLLWRWSALLLVGLALVLAALAASGKPFRATLLSPRALAALAAVLLVMKLTAAPGPSAFWRHTPIGAGRLEVDFQDANELRNLQGEIRRSVIREAEGRESSVALLELDELALYVNGKSDGSALSDLPTTAMSALVGALLRGDPRRVLVIGLGTGVTAGWLAEIKSVERVDVVELEPAVSEMAAAFAPVSFDGSRHPKVRLFHGDGREYVLTTAHTYDLVFSQPSNPYRAGVADLFSREFYRAVAERLEPGGVFVQWMQGYEVDANVVRLGYSTLSSVFPHIESWQVNEVDLTLLSTLEPLSHDLDRLRLDVEREPYRSALRRMWRVSGIEGLYSGFVGGADLARHLAEAADGRVSSDDRPWIELGFARTVGRPGLFKVTRLQALARELGAERPPLSGGSLDWARVIEARQIRETAEAFTELWPEEISPQETARRAARLAYARGDLRSVVEHWFSQPLAPWTPFDRLMVAEALADQADPRTEDHLRALVQDRSPTETTLVEARLLVRRGDADGAADRLTAAFERLRRDPWGWRPFLRRALEMAVELSGEQPQLGARLFAALSEPFAVYSLEETRRRTRLRLCQATGFAACCQDAFAAFEPHVIWEEPFLRGRLTCYLDHGHPLAGRAEDELLSFLSEAPPEL